MLSPLWTFAAACAVAGLALLGVAARVQGQRRRAPSLPEAGDSQMTPPTVTVLLPVRNEEGNLLACLRTLLSQTVQPRVLVVDDHSTDASRTLAEERAAEEPRLEVVGAETLPSGWGGKVHALHCGWRELRRRRGEDGTPPDAVRSATGEEAGEDDRRHAERWILSTDADTRHHPRLLSRALAAARHWDLDLVSVAGHQEVRGMAENLLTPPVFALLDAQLGDWDGAARGEGPPVANGQFLLLREAALEQAGGFEAVRGVAIDDVGLVRAVRFAGGRTGFVRAPQLLRVRMYEGLGAVYRGWRRNLGGLFGERPAQAVGLAAMLAGPALLLGMVLVAGLLTALVHPEPAGAAVALGAAAFLWACGATASAWLRAGSGHRPAWGLLYPLDALFLATTLLQGVRDWRRGALLAWKGRRVEAGRGRRQRPRS